MEVLSSPNLSGDCKEIELLTDGTWKVCKENYEPEEIVGDIEEKSIDFIHLVNNDDENSMKVNKKLHYPGSSKISENFVKCNDLTLNEDRNLK